MITYKGLAAGLTGKYAAIYRKSDGAFRTTGTTFAAMSGVDTAAFRSGLIAVSELTFSGPVNSGRYTITTGNIALDAYNVSIFPDNTAVLPSDDPEQNFDFIADGAGSALHIASVLNYQALETGVTILQGLQRIAAVCAGRVSGAGTGTEIFVGLDEATTRVTVTVDNDGNRTDIVYN